MKDKKRYEGSEVVYKSKKTTALLLSLIMMFSLALNPLSAVYASESPKLPKVEPSKDTKTPTTPPDTNPLKTPLDIKPSTTPPSPKITPKVPTTTTPGIPAVALEKPAKAQGVNYEIKENIKRIPAGVIYELRELTFDRFVTFKVEENAQTNENIDPFGKINGIKYPAGSQILAVSQSYLESFAPSTGEIYIDEDLGNAFKILGCEGQDDRGNELYVVATPDLTEVFSSYSIPEQTIHLTTGNIAYIDPDFELSPESGMPKNYIAMADGPVLYEDDVVKVTGQGNKHILTLKSNVIIFDYPPKNLGEFSDEKKLEKDEDKEYYSDLEGVENKSDLKVTVRVKEGSNIIVENPRLNVAMDLNLLTSQLDAKFSFDCKATADITLQGDIIFNHTLEKCVYGYDINLGKVAGKEKGNAAFVGIFLVLEVNGKISVEVRTVTTGDAEAGFAYKSIGWGSLPYYVGPYAIFRPASFDMNFTVDGEIHSTLACVPQVGVVIWGCKLGVLQIWVGFKSTALFHFQGGGGTDTEETFSGHGSIDLRAFGELVGYLIGKRYSLFYIEFPIYKGEWKIGEEVSGSGGDAVRKVLPYFQVTADAASNVIEGKVVFSTTGEAKAGYMGKDINESEGFKEYYNSPVLVNVYDRNMNLKFTSQVRTDYDGKFSAQFTNATNILPTDWVKVEVPDDQSPVFTLEDGRKFKVAGISQLIKPTVPFSEMDFNVDTVNDVITGWVSGNYTGPVKIEIFDNNPVTKTVNAQDGLFKLDYPINEHTAFVSASIEFEGSTFSSKIKNRNLDAFTIMAAIEYEYEFETPEENEDNGLPSHIATGVDISPPVLPGQLAEKQDQIIEMSTGIDPDLMKYYSGIKKIKKIVGTIINKGDMGWLAKQGDNYVRSETEGQNTNYYNGIVKITEITVQSAVDDLREEIESRENARPRIPGMPLGSSQDSFVATTQATQEIGYRVRKDNNSPSGYAVESYPTSTSKFEFRNVDDDVVAYKIEIEYEGLTAEYIYNPFIHHYDASDSQPGMDDIIGPLREAYRLRAQQREESVVNPNPAERNPVDRLRDIERGRQWQMH